MQELKIDNEFKKLIPELSKDEYAGLEQSIKKGFNPAYPIVTWNGIIIDGHNRYKICADNKIEFTVSEFELTEISMLAERDQIKVWIIENQFNRRNIQDFVRYELTEELQKILSKEGAEKRKATEGRPSKEKLLSTIDNSLSTSIFDKMAEKEPLPKHNTQQEVAKKLGWSTGKTAMADIVHKRAKEEDKIALRTGEKTIHEVYQEIQGKVHVSNNSGNNEWYTPAEYIEIARKVMGGIDCDPASSDVANKTVKAKKYYTEKDDGLTKKWNGNIWMNPPYAQPLIKNFCEKLVEKHENGEIESACVLVNNATETAWCNKLLSSANAVWFIESRIKFIDKEGKPSGAPLQGQIMIYFGKDTDAFKNNCGGLVYVR